MYPSERRTRPRAEWYVSCETGPGTLGTMLWGSVHVRNAATILQFSWRLTLAKLLHTSRARYDAGARLLYPGV